MIDMIHLVNPENPVKVHTRTHVPHEGRKKPHPLGENLLLHR
jgi:hypothetical protein